MNGTDYQKDIYSLGLEVLGHLGLILVNEIRRLACGAWHTAFGARHFALGSRLLAGGAWFSALGVRRSSREAWRETFDVRCLTSETWHAMHSTRYFVLIFNILS